MSSPAPRGRAFAGIPTSTESGGCVAGDDGVRADRRAGADSHGAEDLRTRANGHAVLDGRVALPAVASAATECHAVVQHDVIADLGRLADHDAHAVVDEETASDGRAGVDLDAGEPASELRTGARDEARAPVPQHMHHTVRPHGVQAWVQQSDLERSARGGVTQFCCDEIFAQPSPD